MPDQFENKDGTIGVDNFIKGTTGGILYYQTWEYYAAETDALVRPQSPPNVASFRPVGQTQEGQPQWRVMNSSVISFTQQR